MIKLMLFMSRRKDLSREEFRQYYETRHAPLAAANVPHLRGYVRNYVVDQFSDDLDSDCVSEFWFDVNGSWRELQDTVLPKGVMQMLAEDEVNFIDRSTMRMVVVEEMATPPADLKRLFE